MILILGMGQTGLSVARFLTQQKCGFSVADDQTSPKLLNQFQGYQIANYFCGKLKTHAIQWQIISQVIVSPGINPKHPALLKALSLEIKLLTDIDLFDQYLTKQPYLKRAKVIGITGSNGKSTVVRLCTKIAQDANIDACACGNVGLPVLDAVLDFPKTQLYVLELSSYQLDYLNHIQLEIAVVLNITPDHLDRYTSFENYISSKLRIFEISKYCVKPLNNPDIPINTQDITYGLTLPTTPTQFGTMVCHGSRYLLQGDTVLMPTIELSLLGLHNVENVLSALSIGHQLGLPVASMIQTIKGFQAVKHRLAYLGEYQNIHYYNDSKSTNVQSSLVALEAMEQIHSDLDIIVLIGGLAKKEDYQPLADKAQQVCSYIIVFGQDAQRFTSLFNHKTQCVDSLSDAIQTARNLIPKGVILLSPACASFDEFDNFEHRGDFFTNQVKNLLVKPLT